ncbi:MAG: ankyrin repeat domain-containing protein [bacterium]
MFMKIRIWLLICLLILFGLSVVISANFLKNVFGLSSQPIHDAVQERDLSKLKSIVNKGADINAVDSRGRTPLYLAALYGYPDIAAYLLTKEADPNKGASWKDNATPLHVAAKQGNVEIVKLLLEKGVNPNIQTKHGVTPLHNAARHRKPKVVEILLGKGANIDAKDSFHKGVLHGYEWSPEVSIELTKVVQLLIAAGANVNSITKEGETPLMNMTSIGALDAMELLLSKGAHVNIKNKFGVDALQIAINLDNDKAVMILRKYSGKE